MPIDAVELDESSIESVPARGASAVLHLVSHLTYNC